MSNASSVFNKTFSTLGTGVYNYYCLLMPSGIRNGPQAQFNHGGEGSEDESFDVMCHMKMTQVGGWARLDCHRKFDWQESKLKVGGFFETTLEKCGIFDFRF